MYPGLAKNQNEKRDGIKRNDLPLLPRIYPNPVLKNYQLRSSEPTRINSKADFDEIFTGHAEANYNYNVTSTQKNGMRNTCVVKS